MQVVVGHLADIGPEREYQEDAYAFHLAPPDSATARRRGAILVVADGKPAQQGSGPASRMAANLVCEQYYAAPSDYPVEALRQAMIAANSMVWEAGNGRGRAGMVTRVLCAVVQGDQLILGCVGGSGAYLLHEGEFTPLTYDGGDDGADEGRAALGLLAQVEPEVEVMGTLAAGDRLLLCTDGLHRRISAEQIAAVIREAAPQEACERLRDLARTNGSSESLVALVAEVQAQAGDAEEPAAGGEETVFAMAEPEPEAALLLAPAPEPGERVRREREEELSQAQTALEAREEGLHQGQMALGVRQEELQQAQAALEAREEELRHAQTALAEQERTLTQRVQDAEAREAALRSGEEAQAERDRRLRKLEGLLASREQDLAERERRAAEAREAGSQVEAARAEAASVRQVQAELQKGLEELRRGCEGLDGALRQVTSQTTTLGRDQEEMQRELGGHARELSLWLGKLDEYDKGLRAWQERLAEAEAKAQQVALTARAPVAPAGAVALHEWTCELSFTAALAVGGVQQEERIQLPNGSVVVCGLTVQREFIRRQYPMAIEVWASSDAGTTGRLLVGYGMDVRTMPAAAVEERGLVVLTQGDEVVALPLGSLTVYAAVTQCEFATVARHKVNRDYSAFLSLGICFRAVARAS